MTPAPSVPTWRYNSPAKLNLSLRVTHRRSDGLHDLCSLFAFCGWTDALQLTQVDGHNKMSVQMTGPQAPTDVTADNNLAVKAYHFALEHIGDLPAVHLTLTKNIPAGAGLGGGSGNAAAILRWALAQHGQPIPSHEDPMVTAIRLALGADTYPILEGNARIWTGTGDQPGPPLILDEPLYVLVAFPDEHLATGRIFGALTDLAPSFDPNASLIDELTDGPNSLQSPAKRLSKRVADLLQTLTYACQTTPCPTDNALKVQMSGSGSACFAIFKSKERAREAAQHPKVIGLPHYVGPLQTSAWENTEDKRNTADVSKV